MEIHYLMTNFPLIFTKFWLTMKKRAPPDQNWPSLNKIDKIRQCQGLKTI